MRALDPILAEAYSLSHQDRRQAIMLLRDTVADPEMRDAAEARLQDLAQLVAARSQNGVCGCYVSGLFLELLTAALAR